MRGFPRQLAELGYRIERTAKGWELAGVPQRVLDEFSKRTEQVEQKAKELGITSAKGKDGLAALTRERKQKDIVQAGIKRTVERADFGRGTGNHPKPPPQSGF